MATRGSGEVRIARLTPGEALALWLGQQVAVAVLLAVQRLGYDRPTPAQHQRIIEMLSWWAQENAAHMIEWMASAGRAPPDDAIHRMVGEAALEVVALVLGRGAN